MSEPPEIRVDSERLEVHDHRAVSTLGRPVGRVALVVALSPSVALALAFLSAHLESEGLMLFVLIVSTVTVASTVLLTMVTFPALFGLSHLGRWRGPGAVTIATHSLRIQRQGRNELLELDDVVAGRTRRGGAILRLAGERTLVVPTSPGLSAEVLLHRLASASPVRAARFPIHRQRPWLEDATLAVWLVVTVALVMHGTTVGVPRPELAALAALLALLAFMARCAVVRDPIGRLVAGADGIRIDYEGQARLVRHGDVRSMRPTRRGVVLELADGRSLSLCVVPSRLRHLLGATTHQDRLAELRAASLAELIAARAAEHADARPNGTGGADAASTIDEWRTAIGSALAGLAGAYRQGALTPAQAAAIAEDPRAAAPQRIGAALAIADAGDDEARSRVRIAADLSADDALRAALEEAAHGVLHPATKKRYSAIG